MWFDRLWWRLWVPAAFVGSAVALKWIVFSIDPISLILFSLIVIFFLAGLVMWMGNNSPL
jgi:hypothetical protein